MPSRPIHPEAPGMSDQKADRRAVWWEGCRVGLLTGGAMIAAAAAFLGVVVASLMQVVAAMTLAVWLTLRAKRTPSRIREDSADATASDT